MIFWSGRWDSNPRPQPWQGCALPLSYARIICRIAARPETKRAPSRSRSPSGHQSGLHMPPASPHIASVTPPLPRSRCLAYKGDAWQVQGLAHNCPCLASPTGITAICASQLCQKGCDTTIGDARPVTNDHESGARMTPESRSLYVDATRSLSLMQAGFATYLREGAIKNHARQIPLPLLA